MAKPNNEKITQPIKNRLSIQIGLSGLSFSILNSSTNSILEVKHYKKDRNLSPFEMLDYLKYVLDNEKLVTKTYSQINIIYKNELSTLVPQIFFNEDTLADYLKFNTKILSTDFIAYDELKNGLNIVYVPLVNINNFIFETFGNFTYKHFTTLFIEYITTYYKSSNHDEAFVHISDNIFEMLVINDGKIIHHNTFIFSTKEDFIYYILFSFEQLQQDPEVIPLKLFGEITEESELFKIAYKYIRNVEIGNCKFPFDFNDKTINMQTSIALLTSFLCESYQDN